MPLAYFLKSNKTQYLHELALTKLKERLDELKKDFLIANPTYIPPPVAHPITSPKLGTPSAALPYFKDLLIDFEVA